MPDQYAVQPPSGKRNLARTGAELAKGLPIRWNRAMRYFLHLLLEGKTAEYAQHQSGLRKRQADALLLHPEFRKRYDEGVEVLRANEKARNIHKAIAVRDDETLTSPAGRKVQLDAAKWLHGESDDVRVSARVGVSVSLGYVIDLTGDKGKPAQVIDVDANPSVNVSTAHARAQATDVTEE